MVVDYLPLGMKVIMVNTYVFYMEYMAREGVDNKGKRKMMSFRSRLPLHGLNQKNTGLQDIDTRSARELLTWNPHPGEAYHNLLDQVTFTLHLPSLK